MTRPSHHLPAWFSLAMIGCAVLLMFGFAGMWPAWLMATVGWITASVMVATMAFAILLGLILAFILIVRPRR